MPIKSISLKDFQAHKSMEISISKGITSIQGETDKGKSSILRALRWACLNDFAGEEFIREGAKRTLVAVETDKGRTIERGRGGQDNIYSLDGTVFRSFGQSVPKPIAEALKLSELNFQGQHDPPFWFSKTAGEVSRELNSIIDLTVIDDSLSSIAATVRAGTATIQVIKSRLDEATEKLGNLGGARARVGEFEILSQHWKALRVLKKRAALLAEIMEKIDGLGQARAAERCKDLENLMVAACLARKYKRDTDDLAAMLAEIQEAKRKSQRRPDFTPVQMAYENWLMRLEGAKDLRTLLQLIRDSQNEAIVLRTRSKALESDFHRSIKGQKCPTCGQTIQ